MTSKLLLTATAIAFAAPEIGQAIDLKPATLEAWQQYVRAADQRMQSRAAAPAPYLWMDESNARAARVRAGEAVIEPVCGKGTRPVPEGLIHDWIGAVFIPGATIDGMVQVMHSYGRYKEFYKPVVVDSRMISDTEAGQEFSMVWVRKVLFVNAAMVGRYHAYDTVVDAHRAYNIADSTELREIQDYGHPGQHTLAPDTGNGFIWRMHSIARYEERDGGVYLELEAIALTRDIPSSLRWLVNPVVNHLSINSLSATLKETKEAVSAAPVSTEALAVRRKRGE